MQKFVAPPEQAGPQPTYLPPASCCVKLFGPRFGWYHKTGLTETSPLGQSSWRALARGGALPVAPNRLVGQTESELELAWAGVDVTTDQSGPGASKGVQGPGHY